MKKSKVLLVALCAVLLVAASVMGTLAYLTSQDTVVNTFTVGKVKITLDEAKVKPDGTLDGNTRVKENSYHLIPGMSYIKDPTMTVVQGSEESYVRMLVTIDHYNELVAIFGSSFLPQNFVEGWDNAVWTSTQVIDVDTAANTATYEFRYKDGQTVTPAANADLPLEALFTSLTIPGSVTGSQLETIQGLKISVVGHAIQAAGFADANAAWAEFVPDANN